MHSNCGDHQRRLPEPRVWLEAISIGVAGDSLGGVKMGEREQLEATTHKKRLICGSSWENH
jgi:hypothetical protein